MSRRKGNKSENWVKNIYENAGFSVYKPQESQYGVTDPFGLFDLIAIPEQSEHTKPRFIQVKSNVARGVREWCEECQGRFGDVDIECDFVVRIDGEPGPHTPPARGRLLRPASNPGQLSTLCVDERDDGVPMDGEGIVQWLERTRPPL